MHIAELAQPAVAQNPIGNIRTTANVGKNGQLPPSRLALKVSHPVLMQLPCSHFKLVVVAQDGPDQHEIEDERGLHSIERNGVPTLLCRLASQRKEFRA